MGTLTSRLKLLKPDRLELVKVLDHLNANLDRLDSGGNGAYVCTSTTRPNGNNYPLFDGMQIYESDTKQFLKYVSGTWRGGWIAYTPTVGADTTAPNLGGATHLGRYMIDENNMCTFFNEYTVSNVVNIGNGAYRFQHPPAAQPKNTAHAIINGHSMAPYRGLWGRIVGGYFYLYPSGSSTGSSDNALASSTVVFMGASSIRVMGQYEVA